MDFQSSIFNYRVSKTRK